MWSLRTEVMSKDECSFMSAFLDGTPIPRSPSLAGSANREHSRSLSGGLSVSVGKSLQRRLSSSGSIMCEMPGVV